MINKFTLLIVFVLFSYFNSSLSYHEQVFASETLKGAEKDYESFKEEMSKKYESLSKDFDQLKVKAKEKGSTVKGETIQELDESREKIKKKMSEIKKDSKDQWKSMKKSLSESIDSLHSKIQHSLKD